MQSSQVPSKSPLVFAQNAGGSYVRTIPQTTSDTGAASYDAGFPPQTFTDESAGGSPPDGRDFNGIFRALDAWRRWLSTGAPVTYDAAFQTSIGGYPLGTVVMSPTTNGLQWLSNAENNMSNPESGGAGWQPFLSRRASAAEIIAGTEDQKVITPKGLRDGGGVTVTSSNLNENNGFRTYSDGFKECWGRLTLPAQQSTVITYPAGVGFTSWSNPTITGVRIGAGGGGGGSSNDDNNPGVTAAGTANFTVYCGIDIPITAWWNARGV